MASSLEVVYTPGHSPNLPYISTLQPERAKRVGAYAGQEDLQKADANRPVEDVDGGV